MIAKNLLKFAEAMALQMPLPFKRLRMLCQSRPTTRAGRVARAARAGLRRAILAIKVIYPEPKVLAPLPKRINNKSAQMPLFVWTWTGEWTNESKRMPKMIYGFQYAN